MILMRVGIIGASGFAGGTLVQLLLFHKEIELTYVTSRTYVGKYVHSQIPTLRGMTDLKFELPNNDQIRNKCDVVFTAVPHKTAHQMMPDLLNCGVKVIDLSADFRIKDVNAYSEYYGEHSHPELLKDAVYGMPELHREEIKKAKLVAVPGCQASSTIYALVPLIRDNLINPNLIIADSKTGSSGSGAEVTEASHHPIRSNCVRPYKLTGHRHTAEIEQELQFVSETKTPVKVGFSAHAVDLTRGILTTTYSFPQKNDITEKDVIKAYRKSYSNEKFIRFMKISSGVFQLPDPKLIMGTNYVDVGFELDTHINRIVSVCALDNLVKGTAGNAIQSLNLMCNFKEEEGLLFPGLFPY
jgi:N-acetyl-gamma-glutamyl-phosphate/LysW-gamma-L-alpha-aminoadipyl-6-phosphate reductase